MRQQKNVLFQAALFLDNLLHSNKKLAHFVIPCVSILLTIVRTHLVYIRIKIFSFNSLFIEEP